MLTPEDKVLLDDEFMRIRGVVANQERRLIRIERKVTMLIAVAAAAIIVFLARSIYPDIEKDWGEFVAVVAVVVVAYLVKEYFGDWLKSEDA